MQLASEYARSLGLTSLSFREGDLLDDTANSALPPAVLAIDKGTFDAISLGPAAADGTTSTSKSRDGVGAPRVRALCEKFKGNLSRVLTAPAAVAATFLITSCNWTKEELCQLFAPEFVSYDEISHPSFTFGGRQGQAVTTLAFRRASDAAIADLGHE